MNREEKKNYLLIRDASPPMFIKLYDKILSLYCELRDERAKTCRMTSGYETPLNLFS